MIKKAIILIIVFYGFVSCDFFKKDNTEDAIARVNTSYLYKEDLKNIVPEGSSSQDSTLLVNRFINRWALQQLLMDGAELNLPETKQNDLNNLVSQYKNDLFTKAYIEGLVKKNIDTLVNLDDARLLYEKNKESFKLNEELIKFRYLAINENAIDLDIIKERFKRFDTSDKTYLDSIAVQFKSYSLNDSAWIKLSQVYNKVPALLNEDKSKLLKKSNFIQVKDSIDLYLVQINDVLRPNDYAPLSYVKLTIDQIVINKRKLDLITKLENDITKDAIKNNEFEVYNK
ncbi:peptidyl-prolyl cis-trans isomerase [Ichthyenterobacterium sp. W332]|uniref:Peptidyl-prolyl cis-trans isomerase n=1 Tax=Microcosmobacter mediterraneus TaxID=3075607 RepID=A0ABU2YMQ5_9FLAO|nr:peptidyl-prolyl cis-trans isomerase [Ichthyenterobacterium sp. W332]MDT0559446.1 peptidyl-prolyl cis-trans isomerase [Ichthyenterobacterium sp. W332]